MGIALNSALAAKALAAAHAGDIDHGEWSAPEGAGRTADNSIGHDTGAKGTVEEWKYPIMSGGKVSAKGVGSALGYAKKNNESAIIEPLQKISDAIAAHKAKLAAAVVEPVETDPTEFPRDHATVHTELPKDLADKVAAFRQTISPGDIIGQYGQEKPHIKVKEGISSNSIAKVKAVVGDEMPGKYTLGNTKMMPPLATGGAERLVCEVNSPDLSHIHNKIASSVPHVSTDEPYSPHVHIADMQPGTAIKYAGRSDLSGLQGMADTLIHSQKDGTRTEIPLSGRSGKAPQHSYVPSSGTGGPPLAAYSALSGPSVLEASTGPAEPALVIGMGLPTEIDGQKCHYRRKEIARAGHYVNRGRRKLDASGNPTDQWEEFTITPERMDVWLNSFHGRKQAGIKPFVPERHVGDPADARANFGYVVDLARQGERLYGTFQLIGDEALAAAARNDVSVYVTGPAADAKGGTYPECIEHVCLTANPVIPDLEPFLKIAASAGRAAVSVPVYQYQPTPTPTPAPSRRSFRMLPTTAEQVRAKLGIGADVPDDQLDEKAAQTALALSANVQSLIGERDRFRNDAEAKSREILALSANDPAKLDPINLGAFELNADMLKEHAISKGAITKADADSLSALLRDKQGKPTRLALSASGDNGHPLEFNLWKTLANLATPIRTGLKRPDGTTAAQPNPAIAASGDTQPTGPLSETRYRELMNQHGQQATHDDYVQYLQRTGAQAA